MSVIILRVIASSATQTDLPVTIVGAGPVGLAAAAHLAERGQSFVVFERGDAEHSCGTVPPHGVDELGHPEPDVYIVGMKSCGRAPTFLMITGYEQVHSVVAALTCDWDAAVGMQLVVPEAGVCHGPGVDANDTVEPLTVPATAATAAGGCCR